MLKIQLEGIIEELERHFEQVRLESMSRATDAADCACHMACLWPQDLTFRRQRLPCKRKQLSHS